MHEDVIQTKDLLHPRFVWLNHYLQQHEDVDLLASYCKIKNSVSLCQMLHNPNHLRDTQWRHIHLCNIMIYSGAKSPYICLETLRGVGANSATVSSGCLDNM